MAGTKAGGLKARDKNLAKNPNFYKDIGAKGGRNGTTGGFAHKGRHLCEEIEGWHHYARCAGKKGGTVSRRGKAVADQWNPTPRPTASASSSSDSKPTPVAVRNERSSEPSDEARSDDSKTSRSLGSRLKRFGRLR